MREILFRGKRTDNNEWIEGCLLLTNCKSYISNRPYSMGKVYEADGIEFVFGGFYEVDPATVGRCTGLKDTNERELFDGDIIEFPVHCNGGTNVGKIEYCEEETAFQIRYDENICCLLGYYFHGKDLEIIGNIHDDPELLEVSE